MPKYLKFQNIPLPGYADDWDTYMMKEQAEFDRVNDFARDNQTYVGRTFRIPTADSYSHYQVIGETKHTFRVAWLEVGDCWTDHYYGKGGTFPKTNIIPHINRADMLKKMFSK